MLCVFVLYLIKILNLFLMKKVAVIGSGNMGTALAQVAAQNGHKVKIWSIEEDVLTEIKKKHKNSKYLPGVKLSTNIKPVFSMQECLEDISLLVIAVPSKAVKKVVGQASKFLSDKQVIINFSKGLDKKTGRLLHQVISSEFPDEFTKNILSASGPSIADEFAEGEFTQVAVAGGKKAFKKAKDIFSNDFFKLVYNPDMIGTELGGVLKNIYAIALGICDGFGYSVNTKALVAVRSLDEMSRFIEKMGGKRETVYGLAGVGDLIATGFSEFSRNRFFGEKLCGKKSGKKILEQMEQVVEGVFAAEVVRDLARKKKINLPLAEAVYQIACRGKDTEKTMEDYLKNL